MYRFRAQDDVDWKKVSYWFWIVAKLDNQDDEQVVFSSLWTKIKWVNFDFI